MRGPANLPAIDGYLADLHHTLVALLAAGWRTSRRDAEALELEAQPLRSIGLDDLAARLSQVATASSASDALRAISLATSAIAIVRARIAFSVPADDRVKPLVISRRARVGKPEQLLPLGPVEIDGERFWSCLRSRGYAVEWLVVSPPDLETGDQPFWLRRPLYGHLHWQARRPLDGEQTLDRHRVLDASWETTVPVDGDPFTTVIRRFGPGKASSTKLPLWGGGSIRIAQVEDRLHPNWQFLGGSPTASFNPDSSCWAVLREQDDAISLIALFDSGASAVGETVSFGPGLSLVVSG
jgi:hypothetical protein